MVPKDITPKAPSLIEAMAGVIYAVKLGAISPLKSALIAGQGTSGLILTQVARL